MEIPFTGNFLVLCTLEKLINNRVLKRTFRRFLCKLSLTLIDGHTVRVLPYCGPHPCVLETAVSQWKDLVGELFQKKNRDKKLFINKLKESGEIRSFRSVKAAKLCSSTLFEASLLNFYTALPIGFLVKKFLLETSCWKFAGIQGLEKEQCIDFEHSAWTEPSRWSSL